MFKSKKVMFVAHLARMGGKQNIDYFMEKPQGK
jgi:hypothetical protein